MKPGDRMTKPLKSANISTNNILLKVTVPKRTGLKRRRGADGPFHEGIEEVTESGEQAAMLQDAQYLFRSMQDNIKSYQIEAIGSIKQTHRFRSILILFSRLVSCMLITFRHAGLCYLNREHAASTEIPSTYIAFRM